MACVGVCAQDPGLGSVKRCWNLSWGCLVHVQNGAETAEDRKKRGRVWFKEGRGGTRNHDREEMESTGWVGLSGHRSLRCNLTLLQVTQGPPKYPPRTWQCFRATPR